MRFKDPNVIVMYRPMNWMGGVQEPRVIATAVHAELDFSLNQSTDLARRLLEAGRLADNLTEAQLEEGPKPHPWLAQLYTALHTAAKGDERRMALLAEDYIDKLRSLP